MVRALALLAAVVALAGCGGDDDSPRAPARVVWAVGDAATPAPEPKTVADLIARSRVDRLLYVGDVYETGTLREFRRWYDPLYGRLAAKTSPVVGNHEHANRRRGYARYWRSKLGRAPAPWYVVREAGWELLGLDTELPHDGGSRQVRWLRRQVSRPGTCRIAFFHRPRFSAGEEHGDQPDVAPLWDTLRGHAVAAIGGHDHNLQRLEPVDGIVQFVSGAGGRALYPIRDDDGRVAFGDDTHFGALRLDLRPGTADWSFVAADGSVLDKGTLRCR